MVLNRDDSIVMAYQNIAYSPMEIEDTFDLNDSSVSRIVRKTEAKGKPPDIGITLFTHDFDFLNNEQRSFPYGSGAPPR